LSLSFKRTAKILFDATAAATGAWVPLDNSFNNEYKALCTVSLEGTDWGRIQGAIENMSNPASYNPYIVSVAVVSASQQLSIDIPLQFIRFVKTGNAGNGKVVVFG